MRKSLVLILGFILFQMHAMAQTGNLIINGKVTDAESGLAIPGVNVFQKGTSNGVITDFDGNFSIEVPVEAVLVVSFLGYAEVERRVTEEIELQIQLEPRASALDEIVVVGYGSQRKSDITGSVSSISSEEITQLATQRVDQALQGRAAGVMVLNTDGAPGGNTEVRIRGMNSIYGGNNALIVVDGLQGADLNSINPNDIASIEILKDASATAIYGSQGANGVILITTKSGKSGKPQINYNFNIGTATITKKLDLIGAADYARNINAVELSRNGDGLTPAPIFSEAEIQQFEQNGGTNWQDEIYHTAVTQNHQLSVSGASEFSNYRVSGGFLDQEGILINSGHKRFTLRANVNADITDWARIGVNWAGAKEITNSSVFDGSWDWPNNPIAAISIFAPTLPVRQPDGSYSRASQLYGNPTVWNPVASATEPMIENEGFQNNLNAFLDFTILEGLTLKITGGARLIQDNNLTFLNSETFAGSMNNGYGRAFDSKLTYLQNSNILTYQKAIDKHEFTLTAVAEQQYSESYNSTINAMDFLTQDTGINDLAGANIVNVNSESSKRVINSYMGRVNYGYDGRYLLTASYRGDGSSVFGANNKWGYFPSAAVSWRVSEEDFMQDVDFLSNLKLRTSWGVTGNQGISPYQTLARISSGSNYPYNGGDATDIGFFISAASNPNLKWETTTQTNLGIDVGLWNERINFTADYYVKKTEDLLMPRELPSYTGLSSIIDNVGTMENKGFEFSLQGYPVIGEFEWHTSFNISANKTTVVDLGPVTRIGYRAGGSGSGTNLPFMYLVEGEPFGQMIGWGYEGTWGTGEAAEAARYGQLPGDPHYTDVNNDGAINLKDQKVIGNSLPDFIYGWNNRFTYKNFELSFQIQGKQGGDIFNIARIRREDPGSGLSSNLLNRWTPDNQDTDVPAIIDQQTRQNANLISTVTLPSTGSNTNSRWIEDGSYLRLKTLTLAYNVPKSFTDKLQLQNLRIDVGGSNLITVTDYSGYDPEVSSYPGNDASLGTDVSSYPQSRIWTLGLNLTF